MMYFICGLIGNVIIIGIILIDNLINYVGKPLKDFLLTAEVMEFWSNDTMIIILG